LCVQNNINEISPILYKSPNALKTVLRQFQKSDIVFIGNSTHQLLNRKIFLALNIKQLYDAGVGDILAEGDFFWIVICNSLLHIRVVN
jgi:hypothetical protein